MKRITFFILFLSFFAIKAQVKTPQPSPSATLTQVVGLTEFEISYSRPSMRDRKIFGELVPYDKLWRTGANANTTISFNNDIVFGDQRVKAGKYAIFTIPGEGKWQIFLYSDTDNWGVPQKWNEDKIMAKVNIEVTSVDYMIESFTIDFNNFTKTSAHLILKWENTAIHIPIEVPTDNTVMTSIKESMENPKPTDYYNAAVYFLETDRDIKQAKQWIDKAMKLRDDKPFWMLRQQSLIYAKAGEKNAAIKLAKQSLDAAKEAKNRDYVEMNKASLKEWGAY